MKIYNQKRSSFVAANDNKPARIVIGRRVIWNRETGETFPIRRTTRWCSPSPTAVVRTPSIAPQQPAVVKAAQHELPTSTPARAVDFCTPANRRVWLDSLPDWDGRPVRSWPNYTRLLRAKRFDLIGALVRWRDDNEPLKLIASNDNTPQVDAEGEFVQESEDTAYEIIPSVIELVRAWSRVWVSTAPNGKVTRSHSRYWDIGAVDRLTIRTKRHSGDVVIRSGDVLFNEKNVMKKFAGSSRWKIPFEDYTKPRRLTDDKCANVSDFRASDAESEVARVIDIEAFRVAFGERRVALLDLATSSMTASQIATEFGGKANARNIVCQIDRCLEDYLKMAT